LINFKNEITFYFDTESLILYKNSFVYILKKSTFRCFFYGSWGTVLFFSQGCKSWKNFTFEKLHWSSTTASQIPTL